MDIKEIEKRWSGYRTPNISYEDSANDIWFLLSRIKELEDAIEKVLLWRNFDGDGISDPLREELRKLVRK